MRLEEELALLDRRPLEHSWPRIQLIEVVVFVFLILPSLVLSFFTAGPRQMAFRLEAVAVIFRDLALVFLILYFLWRNGERIFELGWRRWNIGSEILLGILLFLPMLYGQDLLQRLFQEAGVATTQKTLPSSFYPRTTGELVLGTLMVVVIAVAEETIFRGYLILRFRIILNNTPLAVVLSTVLFAVGHGYEGKTGVIAVGLLGLYFAIIYLWRQNLIAPVVMHFLQDFLGIVLVPLTSGR